MSLTTSPPSTQIQELARQGQSPWLDNLRRERITSGEPARPRDAGLTGITSNPTIFEKAIGGSTDYDAALAEPN
jgi:transaldolase